VANKVANKPLDNYHRFRKYIRIMRIVILSNSYGEDRSGALIGLELRRMRPDAEIISFPLISFGEAYKKRGIRVIGGSAPPPSGGFFLKSIVGLVRDLVETLPLPLAYIKRLRQIKGIIDLVIVVGDVPLLLMGWIAIKKKAYFLAPCKSDWMAPHLWIEELLIRRYAKKIFTHDELTARNLREKGIDALFFGNPMMDELTRENRYHPPEGKLLIGILPGSREESYENMRMIRKVIEVLRDRRDDLHFAVAVADTVDFNRMKRSFDEENRDLDLERGAFVDIIKSSILLISLAGTATEQAAGLGLPVMSFRGSGAQTTLRRLSGQKKLLGKAFRFIRYDPLEVASEIEKVLDDKKLREVMGGEGRERMGPPGGAKGISEYILQCEGIQ